MFEWMNDQLCHQVLLPCQVIAADVLGDDVLLDLYGIKSFI